MVDCIIRPGDWIFVGAEWYQVRDSYINTIDIESEHFTCFKLGNDDWKKEIEVYREDIKGVISDEAMAQRINRILASATPYSAVARVVRNSQLSSKGSHTQSYSG